MSRPYFAWNVQGGVHILHYPTMFYRGRPKWRPWFQSPGFSRPGFTEWSPFNSKNSPENASFLTELFRFFAKIVQPSNIQVLQLPVPVYEIATKHKPWLLALLLSTTFPSCVMHCYLFLIPWYFPSQNRPYSWIILNTNIKCRSSVRPFLELSLMRI